MKHPILVIAALFAYGFSSVMAAPSIAAPQTTKTASHAKTPKKGVYVCRDCKMYFSAKSAKKMGYKDANGHKLVKMASAPTGYMQGSKMLMNKMKGEMHDMPTGKSKM